MKKFYILKGSIWNALNEHEVYYEVQDIPDTVWKKITKVYKDEEFQQAFNDNNSIDPGNDYLRML